MLGFTAHFLIMDEAAAIPDEVYSAATPMLAATNGNLWLLSTPQGPRGFFYDEWAAKRSTATRTWLKSSASAESSGRVTESFLNGERDARRPSSSRRVRVRLCLAAPECF